MRKKSNPKTALKKSAIEEFQDKDLQKMIEEKDKIIRKLEFKVQKLEKQREEILHIGSGEGDLVAFYKEKLQSEIEENERAFNLFLNVSNRMQRLTQMLVAPSEFNDESSQVKGLLQMLGQGNQSLHSSQSYEGDSATESQIQNMSVVESEVSRKLDDLQSLCDALHKNLIKIQKDNSNFDKKLKEARKLHSDQVKILNNELKQSQAEKQKLKLLLEKNQQEKNQILAKIANSLDAKMRKQMQRMNREELQEYIKRLMYRVSELETAKTQAIKQNKKMKTTDYQNYQKLLSEVKEIKEKSRLGASML